ncbi:MULTISPECIES: potassium channel family protein [unclassified Streptomyces]|uniref:potassium channel family protein n=1 Tax=unclassified Streptomyces TaxID=2593676 RepID=UPI000DC79D2D|nr:MULTISPECIES: potassium channel family protein [unclassified Streptomyces]AWZ09962.1 two pore domain potassium channel family protein [Streptomyces sp. ICC4]AWZ11083.1 two pore domain potassium channel family protein [Streptomyces sp. ICC1]
MKQPSRQSRWERRTQTPLLVLALGFAVAYAVPIVVPDASAAVHRACMHAEWVVWAAFAADYLMRLGLSASKKAFVRTHWMDLAAVLLPMIQPLRLLRVVSTLMLVGRRARMAPQIRLTTYVAGAVVGLLMFGSLAVLSVEREAPGGNIKNLGDALWWSVTTMTTVGYGDHSPTTGLGRLLAVGLMLSGIALLGVVTANIAAWFISRFERDDRVERAQTAAIAELASEVRALRAEVARLAAPGPGAGPGPGTAPGAGAGLPAQAPGAAPAAAAVSAPTP